VFRWRMGRWRGGDGQCAARRRCTVDKLADPVEGFSTMCAVERATNGRHRAKPRVSTWQMPTRKSSSSMEVTDWRTFVAGTQPTEPVRGVGGEVEAFAGADQTCVVCLRSAIQAKHVEFFRVI